MHTLEQAQAAILSALRPLDVESVPLASALGRFVAAPVAAGVDLPPFDNSAMDGYAVRAANVQSAAVETPIRLRCVGLVPAGSSERATVSDGACVRVFTGSPIPDGADAVVMQEDTRTETGSALIEVLDAVKPWENVRFRGEDIQAGAGIADTGSRMTPALIGLLAATGISSVTAFRRPRVGVVASGTELREPGAPLKFGEIFESNRAAVSALLETFGATPIRYPLVKDDLPSIQELLVQAFEECDLVVSSGGVSVGEFDLVQRAFDRMGGSLEFWKVAIKPGKPFAFGKWRNKCLLALPGNPVSAFVTCLLLVRPAILYLQGAGETNLNASFGHLAAPLVNRGPRRHFMRVRVDSEGLVHSAGIQASHVLQSMARANGLVDVAPDTSMPAGAPVRVLRWD